MSYVAKTYEFLGKLEKLFNKKMFKISFVAISSLLFFFGAMNIYAQEDGKATPDWSGTKEFYNNASDVEDGTEDNMTSHSGQLGLNTAWVVFSTMAPELTVGSDIIQGNANIPADLRLGLLGVTDKAWAAIYQNQPRVDLVAHLQEEWVPGYDESNAGLYAAGEENPPGYDSLMDSGVAPLWGQFRNMAYLFLVVVMIVIGFMIMFRNKIGGQTMVALGNTIPSVIVSLILITFSFAIAGVIIDLGGVLISLLYTIFEGESVSIHNFGALFSVLFHGGTIEDYFSVVRDDWASIGGSFATDIGAGLLDYVGTLWRTQVYGIIGILFLIIGMGVVAVGAIKLLIVLYKAYFELLLNVVLGPIKILMGTFPGNEAAKTNWFTGLIRNVIVFPIVYFIVNLPVFISNSLGENDVVLNLPEKLTGASLGETGIELSTGEGYLGLLINFVLRVFVLYYACQAPKFAEAIIPVKETNRAAADAMAGAKMGMSKLPLIGGLFSGK